MLRDLRREVKFRQEKKIVKGRPTTEPLQTWGRSGTTLGQCKKNGHRGKEERKATTEFAKRKDPRVRDSWKGKGEKSHRLYTLSRGKMSTRGSTEEQIDQGFIKTK